MAVASPEAARSIPGHARLPRRHVIGAAAVVALAAVVGIVLGWQERQLATAAETVDERTRLITALVDLGARSAVGRDLLAGSQGRVNDEHAREDLAGALDSASSTTRAAAAAVHELDAAAERVRKAGGRVALASDEVRGAVHRWELGRAREARAAAASALDEALGTARAALAASSGRVADESVRVALGRAVDAAQSRLDAPLPDEVATLTARTAALGGAARTLDGTRSAVEVAVATWEAERAAEAAAREQAEREAVAAAARPPSGPGASRPSTSSSGSSGEAHWEETVTYEELRICMDTDGNSWEC